MSKGLLAEWRRGIVARGAAAALLLAVPVAVAAAIGFGTSLAGLSEGLDSLASGPDGSQAAPSNSDDIDSAIAAIAGGEGPGPGAKGPDGAPGANESPGGGTPGEGTGTGTGTGTGQSPAGGPTDGIDPPDVEVPNANPVGDLVDGLNDSLNGLLGQ